jgi:UDP-N-acetyl-D-glucosamine dehydrogenase
MAVVGLGYVGLPLAIACSESGFSVLGLDVDASKAEHLLAGRSYIKYMPYEIIERLVSSERFDASTDFARVSEVDAILLCVPTPLTKNQVPDMSFIVATAESIAPHLRKGQLVALESTTYPGTTTEVLRPILERGGLRSGESIYVAYSPEREDPGNASFSMATIPKVVGGDGTEASERRRTCMGRSRPVSCRFLQRRRPKS